MVKNMGILDRIIRVVLAIIFIILYLIKVVYGAFGIILLIFAGIFIITSIIGFCPLYLPLKINTIKKDK
ncbi:MAG: DUF2892 domain-containing protein [Exilispira sp.]